jgi:hypothetical protein
MRSPAMSAQRPQGDMFRSENIRIIGFAPSFATADAPARNLNLERPSTPVIGIGGREEALPANRRSRTVGASD